MTSIANLDETTRKDIVQRLKRIEGQARGIQRMVDEERDCQEIFKQIAAMQAATHSLSMHLLEEFVLHCLHHTADFPSQEKAVSQMLDVISMLTRS
jgi:DNA-binding FrmR family transcriptional regulator